VSGAELGELVEITLAMSRSEFLHKSLIVSPSHPFIGISHILPLLDQRVAAQFLFFYDECDRFCTDPMMHELFVELDIESLVGFLELGNESLTEAALNVISLIIEGNCIETAIISERIVPSILGALLESMLADRFRLKRAALRFIHTVVVRLGWS
jgi:hypothetical protein